MNMCICSIKNIHYIYTLSGQLEFEEMVSLSGNDKKGALCAEVTIQLDSNYYGSLANNISPNMVHWTTCRYTIPILVQILLANIPHSPWSTRRLRTF